MDAGKERFLGDPDFCSECGAILPLPGIKDQVICRVCNHEVDSKEFDGMEITSKIVFNTEWKKESKHAAEIPDGPLVDRKCSKCGHDGMTYATLQTRSADEGQTVFYTCPQCKFKEIENS